MLFIFFFGVVMKEYFLVKSVKFPNFLESVELGLRVSELRAQVASFRLMFTFVAFK